MKNYLDKPQAGNYLEGDDSQGIRNPFSPEYAANRLDMPSLLEPQGDDLEKKSLDDEENEDDDEEEISLSQREQKREKSSKKGGKRQEFGETPDKGEYRGLETAGSSPRKQPSLKRKAEREDTEERGSEADQQTEKSYYRNAICHICREKKTVYGCYYNFKLASCR